MSEITSLIQVGDKTLAIFTPLRSQNLMPTLVRFNEDEEMETWQAHISKGQQNLFFIYCSECLQEHCDFHFITVRCVGRSITEGGNFER